MVARVQARKALAECPKKVANLIDLVNLPSTLREFVGQSQISRLGCFIKVWSYIKANNLLASGSWVGQKLQPAYTDGVKMVVFAGSKQQKYSEL
ncbi:hypothetical protein ACLOJK_035804 [Asimina triloba]